MTDQQLEEKLADVIKHERQITRELLQLINQVEDRKIHLKTGFSSVTRWLIDRFNYSESAAYRRMQSARLLRAVPAVDQKIQTGEVNLTTLAQTQTTIRAEELRTRNKISDDNKACVVDAIGNCSQTQADQKLAELFPETMKKIKQQKIKRLADGEVRVSLTFKKKSYEAILEAQTLLGHARPNADLAEVIEYLTQEFIKQRAKQKNTNGISANVRRVVFQRDKGECQFSGEAGKVCGSRIRLEVDHIQPRAMGGSDEIENLRCICQIHNLFRAEQTFGKVRHR